VPNGELVGTTECIICNIMSIYCLQLYYLSKIRAASAIGRDSNDAAVPFPCGGLSGERERERVERSLGSSPL
jgi:hypothetical protein